MNIHIFPSPLVNDSQQVRELEAIQALGLAEQVSVACTWYAGLPETEDRNEHLKIRRFRLTFDRYRKSALTSALKYLEFMARVFFAMRVEKGAVVNCHSLFVLPIGVLLKITGSARGLIYDAHELETECFGHGKLLKSVFRVMERTMIRFVDETTVVSPSITDWYRREYPGSRIHLLRNVTRRKQLAAKSDVFRARFGIPAESLVFLYVGLVGFGRGIELMLEVFSRPECPHHLVIMGFGPSQAMIEEAAAQNAQVHFHPRVAPDDILEYTQGADVGLCIIENTCLSNYYCLPNKLFEYLHSGIPVVTSDFPDLSEVVRRYDCGWVVPVNVAAVAGLVDAMTLADVQARRAGVDQVRDEIHWDNERLVLREVFRNFVPA